MGILRAPEGPNWFLRLLLSDPELPCSIHLTMGSFTPENLKNSDAILKN